jgi:NAD(P)H-hydrate epimerase
MTGAVALAAAGAMKGGAGLVTAAIPASLQSIMAIKLTEAMTVPLLDIDGCISNEAVEVAIKEISLRDVAVVGPGMGRIEESTEFIRGFLTENTKPTIIDADGLYHLKLSDIGKEDIKAPVILTPHPGEMAFLLDKSIKEVQEDRIAAAKELAEKYGCVAVLKGFRTVVTDGIKTYINPTGNEGMATGGTGDVLSGLIGALAGQEGQDMLMSACTGVYIHGLSGDLAAKDIGKEALLAGDLISYLSLAWLELRNHIETKGLLSRVL